MYRYVTEGTFDAYLWQTVENKQKFISQIMTSKSPVRSCDDVDETALSFAEIKALCAGDPRIKERMDLDVEVAKLKLMKADHQSKQYRLEDQLLKYFPEEIEKHKGFIKGFESDLEVLAAHPHPEDGFAGMEIRGDLLTDKENAGAALLDACKEVKTSDPVQIGSYRGYAISVEFSAWKQEYTLLLKGQMTHRATLGTDPRGKDVYKRQDQDLRDVLAHGLMDEADKQQLSTLLQSGRSNSEIAYWLSRAYPREIETLDLETGDIADYRTTAQGMELEVLDAEEKRLAVLYIRWDEVAPLLRGMYARQLDGFGQEQPQPSAESPAFHSCLLYTSWPKVQRRLAQLIQEDRFYTEEEQDRFDNIDPIAIREALAEHGIVNGPVSYTHLAAPSTMTAIPA